MALVNVSMELSDTHRLQLAGRDPSNAPVTANFGALHENAVPKEDESERAGLLGATNTLSEPSTSDTDSDGLDYRIVLKEMRAQACMAGPLGFNLLMGSIQQVITLSFVGHLGTENIAGAALANSITFMFGRLPLIGLSCALDTLASQAFGAGQIDRLSIIFQRTVLFLATHAVVLTGIVLSAPFLLQALGEDPNICQKVIVFSRALLPSIWLDVLNRPLNRILVAQRITAPQAVTAAIVTLLHLCINLLFSHLGWGFQAIALAYSLATFCTTVLSLAYIFLFGKGYCVWGQGPSLQALKKWGAFGKISYPACIMECAESWCWGGMSIMAGLLPNPAISLAALSISFSLFGCCFMIYLAFGISGSTRVGNALGAGDPKQARLSMLSARGSVPFIWMISAILFLEPHARQLLLWLYTDGTDELLIRHLENLLRIMVVINLFDGFQVVMAGIIQGLGGQASGFRINVFAFYVIAMPSAYLLAFRLGFGVEGLLAGLGVGAFTQASCFWYYTSRVDWRQEAQKTVSRLEELGVPEKLTDAEDLRQPVEVWASEKAGEADEVR